MLAMRIKMGVRPRFPACPDPPIRSFPLNRPWRCCFPAWGFLSLLLLAPTFADAGETNWIWSPENGQQAEPHGDCYFRRDFELKTAPLQSALIEITGDDSYDLFVNGQRLGAGSTWQQIDRYDIRPQLVAGRECDRRAWGQSKRRSRRSGRSPH